MADIVELILADHRRIHRLLGALDVASRRNGTDSPAWPLGPLWRRTAELVALHAEAEQEICYLPLFGRDPFAEAQWRAAVADHDDIRAALQETAVQSLGSPSWWRAVTAVVRLTSGHIEEERGILLSFARRTTPELRHYLAQQWVSFAAARTKDGTARPLDISGRELAQRPAIPGSG